MPGKPDDSEMIERISSDDADELMPPPATQEEAHRRAERNAQAAGSPKGPSISRTGR